MTLFLFILSNAELKESFGLPAISWGRSVEYRNMTVLVSLLSPVYDEVDAPLCSISAYDSLFTATSEWP